jgi:hypothetical protein
MLIKTRNRSPTSGRMMTTAKIHHRRTTLTKSSTNVTTKTSTTVTTCLLWLLFLSFNIGVEIVKAQEQTLPYDCIQDIRQIYQAEADFIINNSNNNDDDGIARTYILCPGMTYQIANLDFSYNMIPTAIPRADNPPLPLRPNIHYKCGDNGQRINLCVIKGGDIQIDGTSLSITEVTGNGATPTLPDTPHLGSNIRFEGLTFVDAIGTSFLSTKPGLITFFDCEWTVRV